MAKYPDLATANADGLIHYWPMEETAGVVVEDVIGGWNGECVASAALTSGEFDATVVTTPAGKGRDVSANWGGNSATSNKICAIRLQTSPESSALSAITIRFRYFHRSHVYDTVSGRQSTIFLLGESDDKGVLLDVYSGDVWAVAGTTDAGYTAFSDPFTAGQWHDVVITGNATSTEIYVNGSQVFTMAGSSEFLIYNTAQNPDLSFIGAFKDSANEYLGVSLLDGIFQDFSIWNRKVTATEVTAMNTDGVAEPLVTSLNAITYDVEVDVDFPITAEFLAISNPVEVGFDFIFPLEVSVLGYQDWVAKLPPVEVQELYRLVITGSRNGLNDLVIGGISSWQATNQAGSRSAYLQAVIPAADQYMAEIDARQDGDLVIQKGYKLLSGETYFEEIMRAYFQNAQPTAGRFSRTLTVSGYRRGKPFSNGHRVLKAVRSKTTQNGKRRVFCEIDLFLQPGMTVDALGETFQADFINYYVNENDKFCEVGER
ncbi:LamG domain-containing protein [Marinobacter nauticus]|uniref:LamG domain-containing protein n=1 Tax=Marinobacter nauticus TaxID=2743 RepID=UPI000EB395D7|nr:LamG domain-containing protein [Marinobacter nauticus]RKR79161.1 concanavalin A-like lectin/glucanase superfamily protein [Marinobacter nauticus]